MKTGDLPPGRLLRVVEAGVESGLSVNYDCDPEKCAPDLGTRYGVASLHVGRVSTLSLIVVPDDRGERPPHAEIQGFPDDEAEAEKLAGALAEQARTIINRKDRR